MVMRARNHSIVRHNMCGLMRLCFLLLISALLVLREVSHAATACYCEGCGCKGGPGWRDKSGHCVSHKELLRRCGNPPSTNCSFEGAKQVCPSERPLSDKPRS